MAKRKHRGSAGGDGPAGGPDPGNGGQDPGADAGSGPATVTLDKNATRDLPGELAKRVLGNGKRSAFQNLPASLKDAGLSYLALRLPGGKSALVDLARLSVDDRVKAFVDAWDMLSPTDQSGVRLEDVCSSVNLAPAEFVGEICRSAYKWNMDLSTLVAMIAQPVIVDRMTEFAMEPEGHKDREMLLKSSGFLPLPKGSRTTINVSAQAAAVAATENGLPSFEQDITENVRTIRGEVIDG